MEPKSKEEVEQIKRICSAHSYPLSKIAIHLPPQIFIIDILEQEGFDKFLEILTIEGCKATLSESQIKKIQTICTEKSYDYEAVDIS